MSVSIPRPAWRAVQSAQQRARERAGQLLARVATTATPGSANDGADTDANTREWSSVMTEPTASGLGATSATSATATTAAAPGTSSPAVPVSPTDPVSRSADWSSTTTSTGPAAAVPAAAVPAAVTRTAPPAQTHTCEPRAINTAWVLPVILLAVCLAATGWLFAHGTAAVAWLIALLVLVFAGVPIGLVALRLFGYEDSD